MPVGLAPDVGTAEKTSQQHGSIVGGESLTTDALSKAAKKNLKRKEKKKQQKSAPVDAGSNAAAEAAAEDIAKVTLQSKPETKSLADQASTDDRKQDLTRQLRALRKKLKQVTELQSKLDSGAKLEPEQLSKIERRKALEDEIEDLELELEDL